MSAKPHRRNSGNAKYWLPYLKIGVEAVAARRGVRKRTKNPSKQVVVRSAAVYITRRVIGLPERRRARQKSLSNEWFSSSR